MKNKILALMATIGLASSVTAVEINENISINGFIDGSWSNADNDSATHDDTDIGLDEVELNFIVSAGNVSGEIHVDSDEGVNGDDLFNIEQAHFTYSFENGLSAQIGVFGSNLGFEREDPAGLYTFSRAYDDETLLVPNGFNFGNVDETVLEGLRLSYSTETISVGVAAVNGVGVMEEEQTLNGFDEDNLDYEITVSFNGIENLVVSAGLYSLNDQEQDTDGDGVVDVTADDITAYTISAAYTLDKLLLAAEYSNIDPDAAATNDLSAYMLLADYDVNDKLGFAVRYSEWETGPNAETDKLTIAPNYAITSSLGAILEYSSQDDNAGNDEDTLALELTYTF
jgi:predicted porin